ncbi:MULTISPECIES: DUF1993 domain-containing protein [Sphingomonas]|uniref:DUF1993 domain-containing protein n=1 Tax=Sphingomonas TaxID=13687 RepID=UPI000DEF266C|nr:MULTISPECIES: DUF1993 domain-containing protein [Sphingomonas]
MSLTAFLVPTLTNQLSAMLAWLDKAEGWAAAQGRSADELLPLRLAPDMWPLASQLRIAAFQAMEPIYRLRGQPVPDAVIAIRTEGANAGDHPGTLADGRARLHEALALLATVAPDEFDADEDAPLVHDLPMGIVFDMTRATYVRDWALPQVVFHQGMTYALLRHDGVPLGKIDYAPHLMAYIRPGTMPGM